MTPRKQPAATEETAPPETEPAAETAEDDRIRGIVHDVLESLGITGAAGGDETTTEETTETGKPGARTQAAVEADVESRVRSEIAKLRTEEDRDNRLAALEAKTAEPERAPIKERVSTRLMGWSRR